MLLTEPRAEYLAADELARDGFEVFLPRVKVTETRLGHTDTPLFPGYIFLRCPAEDGGWPLFKKIHRIVKLVSFGEGIPTVPHEVIQELEHRLAEVNEGGGLWRNCVRNSREQPDKPNTEQMNPHRKETSTKHES